MSSTGDVDDADVAYDAGRWTVLRRTFDDVVAADDAARAVLLAELERTDPALRAELEALLTADLSVDDRLAHVDALFGDARHEDESAVDALGIVGHTIGHFRVIEPLATGGMGVVYRAEDVRLGRAVALKFPLPHRRAHRDIAQRFRREARAAAALDHPNICAIHETGETDDGQLFLAMALYEGETLKARIAREAFLPVRDALAIAGQIASGLAAAHRVGIVHRDLKPGNIMLLAGGGVKILDFGLARMADTSRTESTGLLGTVAYMAPEQIRGDAVDLRADLWALGVVLYEMLTGARPFDGEREASIMHAVLHADVVPPSTRQPDVPPAMDDVVIRLLTREPAARFASADDVIDALASLDVFAPATRSVERGALSRTSGTGRATRLSVSTRGEPTSQTSAPGKSLPHRPAALALRVALALALPLVGVAAWLARTPPRAAEAVIIAVLPFQEPPSDDAYLGDGIADALATQLALLPGATVAGAQPLAGDLMDAAPADVARRRGAGVVVSGSVRPDGDSVFVSVSVFDARRQRSSTFEDVAARHELPTLQESILRETADALGLGGRGRVRTLAATLPTTHAEAWDLYLRGRAVDLQTQRTGRGRAEALQEAQSRYALARELDPAFALARARLAYVHATIAFRGDTTAARREQARIEAEAALRAQPDLADGLNGLAAYWLVAGDMERAVETMQRAVNAAPNRADLRMIYSARLRSLGRWDDAATQLEHAIRIDPHDTNVLYQAGLTFGRMRRYRDGVAVWDRLIALQPDPVLPHLIRGFTYQRLGINDTLAATVQRIPRDRDDDGMTTWARVLAKRVQRRYAEALAELDSARQPISRDGLIYRPLSLQRASILTEIGDHAAALPHYRTAIELLEDSIAAYPRDPSIRIALAVAFAGVGRADDAVREARIAMQHAPFSHENLNATAVMGGAVEVFIRAGRYDDALQLIELLLSMPAGREISVPLLRIEPLFDPLRSDPRFEEVLQRFSRS